MQFCTTHKQTLYSGCKNRNENYRHLAVMSQTLAENENTVDCTRAAGPRPPARQLRMLRQGC